MSSSPGPAAPYPEHVFALLQAALDRLDEADVTKEDGAIVNDGLAMLSRVVDVVLVFDHNSFPPGTREALIEAYGHIKLGEVPAGLARLRKAHRDLESFWSTH